MKEPSGVLVVDKLPMLTSHDVVDAVRLLIGTRRVGHTGTLDPLATGVLVLVIGKATRLSQYLMVDPKEYEGEMTLGVETDTYDITGDIVAKKECSSSDEEIATTLKKFVGPLKQIPPMRSAKKVGGVPLYKLARMGVEVEREPKEVVVYELDLLDIIRGPEVKVRFRLLCSKGTYIRAICHDFGKDIGCGAALSKLRRTRCGMFSIQQANTLEELEKLSMEGRLEEVLIKPADALSNYHELVVKQGYVSRVVNGEALQLRMVKDLRFEMRNKETVRLMDERGRFLGLANWYGDFARKPQDVVARSFLVMVV